MKAILIIIAFSLIFLSLNQWVGVGADDPVYYEMAFSRSAIATQESRLFNQHYSPIFPQLSSYFVYDPLLWKLLIIALFAIVTPLLLVKLTGKWYAALFYFTTTNYFYYITNSLYAQGLLIIFVLALWCSKKNWQRLLFVTLGVFTHSTGILVMPIVWGVILLQERKFDLSTFFPAGFCSPVWGKSIPTVASQPLTSFGHQANEITINTIGSLLLKRTPLPFLWKATQSFFVNKQYGFLLLAIGCFFGSFLFHSRILDFLSILMVIGFTQSWETIPNKKPWIVLITVYGFFHFTQWILISTQLLCS